VLLVRENCAFCDHAKRILDRLGEEFQIEVSTLDLAAPEGEELATRGGLLFPPGIVIEGRPFSYGRPSEGRLRRELQRLTAAERGGPALLRG
jgi:glutaredoxin